MNQFSDKTIIESWQQNVKPWVKAIERGEIKSRVDVTNEAIVSAIKHCSPTNMLDVGCGEGWLIRALSPLGVKCLGIDVVAQFSDYVLRAGGRFQTIQYEEINPESVREKFDVIACNFSLIGKESVENIFRQSPFLLNDIGALIVQTLHPIVACGSDKYEDGWRHGNWEGFNEDFVHPAPWYFRTIESWKTLFDNAGYTKLEITETTHPQTNEKCSILFKAMH